MKQTKQIRTEWRYATYDVWGNASDGYEVNDVYRRTEPVVLMLAVETMNPDTPQAFETATPTDRQIRRVFGLGKVQIDTSGGDDMMIIVDRARDGYPLGEMTCTSHESLSPIREKVRQTCEHSVTGLCGLCSQPQRRPAHELTCPRTQLSSAECLCSARHDERHTNA